MRAAETVPAPQVHQRWRSALSPIASSHIISILPVEVNSFVVAPGSGGAGLSGPLGLCYRSEDANQSVELKLGVLAGKGESKKAGGRPAGIMYKRRMNAGPQEPSLQHRGLVSVPRNERNNGTRHRRAWKAHFAQGRS